MQTTAHRVAETLTVLREQLDSALPIFVLIDPLLGEPPTPVQISTAIPDTLAARSLYWDRQIEPIRLCKSISLPQHQAPYLVVLNGIDDPLLEFTVEVALGERSQAMAYGLAGNGGAPHRIGGWLQSDQPASQSAHTIAKLCRLNTDLPAPGRYLRIVDRRTLAFLRYLAGDGRIASQFAGLNQWCYLDALGNPTSLSAVDSSMGLLGFTKDEWILLRKGEEVHRTMHQWLGELELEGAASPPVCAHGVYPAVVRAVEEATRLARMYSWRFTSMADITTWAAMSLAHPSIAHAGSVQHFLAQKEPGLPQSICSIHPELRELLTAKVGSAATAIE